MNNWLYMFLIAYFMAYFTENLKDNLIPIFSLVSWFLDFSQHLLQEYEEHETYWRHQYETD